jgi:hypothetical protein
MVIETWHHPKGIIRPPDDNSRPYFYDSHFRGYLLAASKFLAVEVFFARPYRVGWHHRRVLGNCASGSRRGGGLNLFDHKCDSRAE